MSDTPDTATAPEKRQGLDTRTIALTGAGLLLLVGGYTLQTSTRPDGFLNDWLYSLPAGLIPWVVISRFAVYLVGFCLCVYGAIRLAQTASDNS